MPRRRASQSELRLIYAQCAHEAPGYLLVFTAMSILGTVSIALFDDNLGVHYALSNLVTIIGYVVASLLIWRRLVPHRWFPTVTAAAMVLSVLVMGTQIHDVGAGGFGGMILVAGTFGAVVLTWPAFLLGAIGIVVTAAPAALSFRAEYDVDWLIVVTSALLVSATLTWVRRRALKRLAAANDTIERLATHDALTTLLNRHGLEASVPILASVARREGGWLFSVFVDISGLKSVNDEHGHLVGDLVIKRVAAAVSSVSRDADLVCRWGGDEFLVIGIGDRPDSVELRARIVRAIDVAGIEGLWRPDVGVGTASAAELDLDALVHEADASMYRGRGLR